MVRFGASFRQGLMHVYRRLGEGGGLLVFKAKKAKKARN